MAQTVATVEKLTDQIEAGNLWELDRMVSRAMDALRVPPGDAKTNVLSGGEKRRVAGRLERYGDMLQMVHPDHVLKVDDAALGQMREPIYSLAEGLTQPRMGSLASQAL